MQELANKVAIITGGGYGIGREIGLLFARAGAKVVLAARSADRLESTRAEIAGRAGNVSRSSPTSQGRRLRADGGADARPFRTHRYPG